MTFDISRGALYLDRTHEKILQNEPQYVRERYNVIVLLSLAKPVGITRGRAARMLHRSKRQVYRILARFMTEGISGLRHRPKRPKHMPRKSPRWLERKVERYRHLTGFSPHHLSVIVNEDLRRRGYKRSLYPSLAYKILLRLGLARRPERPKPSSRSFDWKRPNHLIQADITDFYRVPILTMEDDHSRKAWATVLRSRRAKEVAAGMDAIGPAKYDNLLTDNGWQFLDKCPELREYRAWHVTGKHIHATAWHPQTLGKLSAYQKGLKRFLDWTLGETGDRVALEGRVRTYNLWYNNGRPHSAIGGYPEEVYSGTRDRGWFGKFVGGLRTRRCASPSV